LINSNILNGKIALIDRGSCPFVTKVQEAQNAGAVAVIIVNNVPGAPITMGGTSTTINIPSIMISQTDGNLIKSALTSDVVNATLVDGSGSLITPDGDFDNGIIAHEYGHGISIRIAGGPSTSSCLSNAEQMGEGWSDWFGLMLTMEPGDQGSDVRGIGTYSLGQATAGGGIRPAPYSTDFGVNSYTYGNSNDANISVPHGVGFIFATVLWDLNWALIDAYGGTPDPNLHTGTGGNNIAMRLIIEGLKLQPCSPGMIDGRDAIIAADQILYGGAHNCLIWNVFANRGFGYSADQGSTSSRSDQIEAFDLPPFCQAPTTPPTAAFSATPLSTCDLEFNFTDFSTDIPQSWLWDFGDGTSSTIQNPNHTYASSGSYTVKLVVSNSAGADSTTQTVSINLPATPAINEVSACIGDSIFATATATDLVEWSDVTGTIVATGDTLLIPPTSSPATYLLRNSVANPSTKIGPSDNSIGGGGYHGTGFHGALNFTANQGCEILSAWVNAQGAGNRTFILGTGDNNGTAPIGTDIVDQVTVFLVDGPQRIDLNLSVPGPGNYNVGATLSSTSAVYRNNSGTNYPYSEPTGLIDIVNSSSTSNPTGYYYYLYDIEVREKACYSDYDTLQINPATVSFSYVDSGSSFYFQDQSVNAFTWNWDFGDGSVSIQQNPVHTYANPGNYLVRLSVNSGVCAFEQNVEIGDPCNDLIDSVQTVNVAQGIYRVHLNAPLPAASSYTVEWKPDTASVYRSKTFTNPNVSAINISVKPWFNNTIALRLGVDDGTSVSYSCEQTFSTPCRPMTLQTAEQRPARCDVDSSLVRVIYSGGHGVKSILWSNGATTKRTLAGQGQTLTVTITDATGCSLTDSITAATFDNTAVPDSWTLTKGGPTIYNGSFTAPTLPAGATLIGYRMAYRLRNTLTWTQTPLSQSTTISVDFTGSGLPSGNYEFVAFTRYNDGTGAINSGFTCPILKGYNGSGAKSGANAANGSDVGVASIYPNPAHDKLYVTAANGSEVTLTDLGGRILGIQTIEQSEVVFDLTGIAMGVYLIEVHSNGEVVSERVVKQ
jgi:PKD repeat protein